MYTLADTPIILASGSPRRSEMLQSCGIAFEKYVSECDEAVLPSETPKAMVERLAHLKAQTVATSHPSRWVLGADTTVVVDGDILGKPSDEEEAFSMLSRIQGREHEVWGAFSLVHVDSGIHKTVSHCSRVTMVALNDASIRAYIKTNEPMDKAGSYAIQGIGASIVAKVEGSYTNVVGLNLSSLLEVMLELKIVKRGQ